MSAIESISTERLLIRELKEEDFPAIHKIKSNTKVVRYLTWGPNSEEQTLNSLMKQISFQLEENRKIYVLAIVLKETNQVIGNALFIIRDEDKDNAEIGYFIDSEHWGKGLGREVIEGLLNLGFMRFDLHRLYATCDMENINSISLLKKSGFRLEGKHIKDLKVKGEWRDNYFFALLNEEYIKLKM